MKVISVLFITWLWCASLAFADPAIEVDLVTEKSNHVEVLELLESHQKTLLDVNKNPELKKFSEQLPAFLKSLLTEDDLKDGAEKIHIALVDDMSVNANFAKISKNERLILINIGLLRAVDSDDELAFVLGHELEHGPSVLQKHIDFELKNDVFQRGFLKRVVENEVDIKSMALRLHKKGYNPYASLQFFEKINNEASFSHTSSKSRADTLSLGITAIKRAVGEKVLDDKPENYQHALTGELKSQYLNSDILKREQLKKLEDYLKKSTSYFYSEEEYFLYSDFSTKFKSEIRKISEILDGITTLPEWIEIQHRIQKKMFEEFKAKTTKFKLDEKIRDVDDLEKYLRFTDNGVKTQFDTDLISLKEKELAFKADLLEIQSQDKSYKKEYVESLEKKIIKIQKEIEEVKTGYNTGVDQVLTQVKLGQEREVIDRLKGDLRKYEKVVSEIDKYFRSLKFDALKGYDDLAIKMLSKKMSETIKRPTYSDRYLEETNEFFEANGKNKALYQRYFSQLFDDFLKLEAEDGEKLFRIHNVFYNSTLKSNLNDYCHLSLNSCQSEIRKYLVGVIQKAKNFEDIKNLDFAPVVGFFYNKKKSLNNIFNEEFSRAYKNKVFNILELEVQDVDSSLVSVLDSVGAFKKNNDEVFELLGVSERKKFDLELKIRIKEILSKKSSVFSNEEKEILFHLKIPSLISDDQERVKLVDKLEKNSKIFSQKLKENQIQIEISLKDFKNLFDYKNEKGKKQLSKF